MAELRGGYIVAVCLGLMTLCADDADAMPMAPLTVHRSDIVEAQVHCDNRGCFGYGTNQWYRRPTYPPPYLPPNNRGTYNRPAAVGVPKQPYARLVPPPQQPLRPVPPPARLVGPPTGPAVEHARWCLDRYRSYDAATDTYRLYNGDVRRCRPPVK